MKRIYANIDSADSISYLAHSDFEYNKIEMSQDTINALPSNIYSWLKTHKVEINTSLGYGIVCGVIE